MPAEPTASSPVVGSVVIPAHDEATRGFRVLTTARSLAARHGFRVVVVCNGCTDGTAALAREGGELEVLEVATASKAAAMNAGDEAAGTSFPRLYLDADVAVDPEGLVRLADAVRSGEHLAAGPSIRYETDASSWTVRRYHRALVTLPFLVRARAAHLDGRGAYAVSEEGRRRFDAFPPLRADDTFFDRCFLPDEKVVLPDVLVQMRAPRTTAALLRGQSRSAQGAHEIATWFAEHAPERLDAGETSPLDGLWARTRHHAGGAGLLDHPSPSSLLTFVAWGGVETWTRTAAALRRRTHRDTPWR